MDLASATKEPTRQTIERQLQAVRARIESACKRSGRSASEVELIAVTKNAALDDIRALYDLGVRTFAENRPQALWERAGLLPADVRWHLIGSLQSNKVRRTLPLVVSVDSIDRPAIARTVSDEAHRLGKKIPVLIEVKLTDEPNKHGFAPGDLEEALPAIIELPGLHVAGWMAMARHEDDPEACRPTFRALRELRDRWNGRLSGNPPLEVLSMGMTNDFEVAIEEGATQVRIGSALFARESP